MTTAGLLAGKIAFITGAGRGIGAAAATLFSREGAAVVLAARTESELVEVVEKVRADGGTADHVVCDVTDAASVQAAVDTVVRLHGRLDGAFNNAGISIPRAKLAEVPEADFDRITAINFKSVWLTMGAEIRAIQATARTGAICNNSSIGSYKGWPELSPYAAGKRGVNSLTETAAIEYGPEGIRVNAVGPGTTMTAMMRHYASVAPTIIDRLNSITPLRRAAEPEEIAEAAAWLLSDRASYVSGVSLPVDGGMRA